MICQSNESAYFGKGKLITQISICISVQESNCSEMNGGISMTLPSISEEDDEEGMDEEEEDESEATKPLQRPPTPPGGGSCSTRDQATSPADFGTFLR